MLWLWALEVESALWPTMPEENWTEKVSWKNSHTPLFRMGHIPSCFAGSNVILRKCSWHIFWWSGKWGSQMHKNTHSVKSSVFLYWWKQRGPEVLICLHWWMSFKQTNSESVWIQSWKELLLMFGESNWGSLTIRSLLNKGVSGS